MRGYHRENFPHFISPNFIEDIDLTPLPDQEYKLWTRDPNGASLLKVTVLADKKDRADYLVRNDITLGDFKRLLLRFHAEPFIVNHICKNTDRLADIIATT